MFGKVNDEVEILQRFLRNTVSFEVLSNASPTAEEATMQVVAEVLSRKAATRGSAHRPLRSGHSQ
jgi:hypothetical protein